MNRKQDLLTYIRRTLSYLQTDISNSNGLRLYDGNIAAEEFYCKLLNLIYGCSLKTLENENKNFPDIDLIDRSQELAIQVTSDNESTKIKKTILGFFSKAEFKDYELWLMLIAEKAKDYEADFTYGGKYSFDKDKHIKDIPRLLGKMKGMEIPDLKIIANFLEEEVPGVESRTSQKFYPGPFLPDLKYFVGREDLLATLATTLQTHQKASIHDISGLGKTFACYKFANDNQDNYSKIFFVNCAKEAMMESLAKLGQMLHPRLEEASQEEEALAFKNWLETNDDWLAIYDNVDLPFELIKYIPNQKKGDCLFTSNFGDIADLGGVVNINKLSVDNSRHLLFNRQEGSQNEEPHFNDSQEEEYFEKIIAEIDGLPLALSTTGAFIRKKKLKFKEFWRRFEKKEKVIIENEDGAGVYKNGSALRAFLVALEENTTQKDVDLPGIAGLVKLVYEVTSFISPDDIPEEFLRSIFEMVEVNIEVEDADEYWEESRARICNYDLFKMDENRDTFSTHRLIQKTIQSQIPEDEIIVFLAVALNLLTKFFPAYDYDNKLQCEKYYQHTLNALGNTGKVDSKDVDTATLLQRVARYQELLGNYEQAMEFYQKSLDITRKAFGEEHENTSSGLNNLAMIYDILGKSDEGVKLYEQAIKIDERTIGKKHPKYATSINNLAMLYKHQERYDDAIELCLQAIEIGEKTLGREHPVYATRLNNLAEIYRAQGKYGDAIKLYRQAVEIDEITIGKEHPDYANHLNNLALAYFSQEKYSSALPLVEEALRILTGKLPPEHPDIANANMGVKMCKEMMGRVSG